jgi:hypothetical protein
MITGWYRHRVGAEWNKHIGLNFEIDKENLYFHTHIVSVF